MFPLASAGAKDAAAGKRAGATLFEQVPGLKDGAERVLAAVVKNLQTMAGSITTIEGAVAMGKMMPMRDVVATHRGGAVAATVDCAGAACTLLVMIDASLVQTIVELLCGGNGAEPMPDTMRQATPIDGQYAHTLVTLIAGAITTEWAAQGFGTTKGGKIADAPQADVCGSRIVEGAVVVFAITIFGVRGVFSLILPPAAIDAFVTGHVVTPATTQLVDAEWTHSLHRELAATPVKVNVTLDALPLSLRAISTLEPGRILALPVGARTQASLTCDGRTFFRGEIGQEDDRYSLRIDDIVAAVPQVSKVRNDRNLLKDLPRA